MSGHGPAGLVTDGSGGPVVHLRGEFDMAAAAELRRLLDRATDGRPVERIVIDMSATELLDCASARVIAEWRRALPADSCPVVLRNPRPVVRLVLEVMGLDGPCVVEGSDPVE